MSGLNPAQFDEFFHALYGCDPFPWQARLARRVAGARGGDAAWPEALALQTAAGKTACIDMAVFALACDVDRPSGERAAPRRVFFVVDRRVIVDATFRRGRDLALRLQEARTDGDGILKEVAVRLARLARLARGEGLDPEERYSSDDPGDHPLAVFQLRGGMYRDDSWARSPLQPTVIVTTVDQFASRLLFRGYGSSPGMRPIHAGLAANDCLIVLDEAHCANPFRQTVDAVRRYRQWAGQSGGVGSVQFHLTLLSATPPAEIKDTLKTRTTTAGIRSWGPGSKHPSRPGWSKPETAGTPRPHPGWATPWNGWPSGLPPRRKPSSAGNAGTSGSWSTGSTRHAWYINVSNRPVKTSSCSLDGCVPLTGMTSGRP